MHHAPAQSHALAHDIYTVVRSYSIDASSKIASGGEDDSEDVFKAYLNTTFPPSGKEREKRDYKKFFLAAK